MSFSVFQLQTFTHTPCYGIENRSLDYSIGPQRPFYGLQGDDFLADAVISGAKIISNLS